jgi:hypothetical protein
MFKIIKMMNMKRIKFLSNTPGVFLLGVLALAASCTKDFDSINTNKNAVSVIGPAQLPFLLTQAQSAAPNSQWNYQVAQNLFADQYCQYFACEATYFGSDRLVINQNWVGAAFNPMYNTVVPQLQSIFAATDPSSAEYAIASIWWVYTFHRVTDYWGPIPYFNAGQPGLTVAYDSQDKIYYDFFDRLKTAVTVLNGHTTETPYGSYDIVYGGSVSNWIKFANSLRLRLALRISNVDPTRAQAEAEAAVAGGVMTTSPGDDALVQRSVKGGDGNGLAIMEWNEFRMSASMESVLKGYQDPRMKEYYMPSTKTGDYEGLRNGLTSAQLTDPSGLNSADYNSHHGARWSPPDYVAGVAPNTVTGIGTYLATSQNVMCTAESFFNRAEGAIKGWNMNGTAQSLYNEGIKQSFAQWGVGDATAYTASTNVPIAPQDFLNSPPMTNIPVLFGATQAIQLEQIATQKWIAMFPEGMEAWADYRRSKLVKLYPVANSDNSLITNTSTQWLRRIPFLTSEKQTNKAAVDAAVSLLGAGGDSELTPLWWDKN